MSLMQHYAPQYAEEQLFSGLQNNYSIAQSYYSQRRQNFLNLLKAQAAIKEEAFIEDVNRTISEQWSEEIRAAMQAIYFSNQSQRSKIAAVKKQFKTVPYRDQLVAAISSPNPRAFWLAMGLPFEQFLNESALKPLLAQATNFSNGHLADILQVFTDMGQQKSKAAIVTGQQYVRPDNLIACTGVYLSKEDGVLMANANGEQWPIEMQGQLTLDFQPLQNLDSIMVNPHTSLQAFAANAPFFGFSAKTWKAGATDGKVFMHSKIMQDMLNTQYFNQPSGNVNDEDRHTWNLNYTYSFITYLLSQNIFNIVGPTNIAMLTGGGLIWMDEFLSQHIFYMRVQTAKVIGTHQASADDENQIFPQINDSGIYVRYAVGKMGTAAIGLKTKKHNTQQDGQYIDLGLAFG